MDFKSDHALHPLMVRLNRILWVHILVVSSDSVVGLTGPLGTVDAVIIKDSFLQRLSHLQSQFGLPNNWFPTAVALLTDCVFLALKQKVELP